MFKLMTHVFIPGVPVKSTIAAEGNWADFSGMLSSNWSNEKAALPADNAWGVSANSPVLGGLQKCDSGDDDDAWSAVESKTDLPSPIANEKFSKYMFMSATRSREVLSFISN